MLPPEDRPQGFILIAVLWITALLSMFALHYSSSARMQGLQARHTADWLTQASLLQSGLDWGYHEYRKYRANQSLLQSEEQLEAMGGMDLDLKYPRQEPYTLSAGDARVAVRITDLGGKIGVNEVDAELMGDILSACGLEEGVRQTTVINSLLDWKDGDDLHRTEGAEDDYYLGLDSPYRAKNGPLESVEELLLIKGVDGDLFYGTTDHPGLVDFLTVYGEQTQMDINSAREKTFYIIPNIPDQVVEDIVEFRRRERIEDVVDLVDVVPNRYFAELQRYYTVNRSGHVEIEARMITDDGSLGQGMRKIFGQDGA